MLENLLSPPPSRPQRPEGGRRPTRRPSRPLYTDKDWIAGALVVDKPPGYTSHQVVEIVRRGTGIRRAGHTGTLDPRASGVLVVLLGPAVRLSEWVASSDKRYLATIRLGEVRDTYDAEGQVLETHEWAHITEEELRRALKQFEGELEQVPPPYSAVRVQGKRAYNLARQGKSVSLKPRKIHVYHLELLEWDPPDLIVDVHCSSGTYVRSLAHDLGKVLGTGAYLLSLRRTQSGRFTLHDAVPLSRLEQAFQEGTWYRYLIPAAEVLPPEWPTVVLDPDQVELVRRGHRMPAPEEWEPGQLVRAVSEQGDLVAVMYYVPEAKALQPKKVLLPS